jgi:hypothetical protein
MCILAHMSILHLQNPLRHRDMSRYMLRDLYPSVSWHKSLRHVARPHPSALTLSSVSVQMSQEEEVLCYRRATSTLSKEFMTTDLPFPLMLRRVAASQPINGHMYRYMIFVAEHTATCRGTSSSFVPIQCAATFVP